MRRCAFLLALLVAVGLALPGEAGIFGKHAKVKPEERVPQLLAILKTDPEEAKREAAAKELRDFEATAFPEMIPTLVSALQGDSKAGVRIEAAETLGKLRPISQEAGQALEQAQANDASMRVRLQARRVLLGYRLHGYRSPSKLDEAPPAAASKPGLSLPFVTRTKAPVAPAETPPPPLATPETTAPRVPPVPQQTAAPPLALPPGKTTEDGPALPPH